MHIFINSIFWLKSLGGWKTKNQENQILSFYQLEYKEGLEGLIYMGLIGLSSFICLLGLLGYPFSNLPSATKSQSYLTNNK